jgi:hypothetical protein
MENCNSKTYTSALQEWSPSLFKELPLDTAPHLPAYVMTSVRVDLPFVCNWHGMWWYSAAIMLVLTAQEQMSWLGKHE